MSLEFFESNFCSEDGCLSSKNFYSIKFLFVRRLCIINTPVFRIVIVLYFLHR